MDYNFFMIQRLFNFLFSFFRKNTGDDLPTYSHVVNSPAQHIRDSLREQKKLIPQNDENINKNKLIIRIKKNIFYLESLSTELTEPEYQEYYEMVTDLKKQSEGCLKIVYRIKETAPYFRNTMKAIVNHTKTIYKLIKDNQS